MLERFRLFFPDIKLHYSGREEKASSATGSFKQHKEEQEKLMEEIFHS
jgi:2-oxoglutarate dehydrogenase complex dehydrogenase (E1) component-like enzyme